MTDGLGQAERIRWACDRCAAAVAELTERVCAIPAPTFGEERRGTFVRDHFTAIGLECWIDDINNVYARYGDAGERPVLVSAHTDTVFPASVPIRVRREGDRLVGPGIGDNSLAVATLMLLPRMLEEAGVAGCNLLLCANVGEEGLGNLAGMRRVVREFGPRLSASLVLEGHDLGRVINQAVGSRRYRITVTGPGGHSWGAFGTPSAIHVLAGIVAEIARLPVPAEPRTTLNVGVIEGGVSVNTIAPRASMLLDLRSVDAAALNQLASRVETIVQSAGDPSCGIESHAEVIGDRPAGYLEPDAPVVAAAREVLQSLGVEPRLTASSTDANVPIAEGIPAVCVGLTRGGNAHREDEYIEVGPISAGLQQVLLLLSRIACAP